MADIPYIIECYWPNIWSLLFPTMFPASLEKAGPKHSTSVSSSVGAAVPLRVDEKEVTFAPNSVPGEAVKGAPDCPQGPGALAVLCESRHSLLPPTLQMVTPSMSPVTVHLKVKVSPGQVGGGPVSCPATSPGEKIHKLHVFQVQNLMSKSYSIELPWYHKIRVVSYNSSLASCTLHREMKGLDMQQSLSLLSSQKAQKNWTARSWTTRFCDLPTWSASMHAR